ncbi:MAG: translation initiation factor IF-2 [bacterium]|nr:translation initiation factor IF-2 [bacterium]
MLQSRPPIITIMGHVDHGKTSLLDYIRSSRIASGEAGGITQHIGAYQIEFQGKKLTFIDTPGHAAFNKMRERGARITDIVVLVVAVNDGVKPQTIESIRHIKESNVSVIVAINKSDLKDVYPDVVKSQLAENGILVQGFGGSVDVVPVSAKTGMGVDTLLETIAVTADLMELQADPDAPLEAVVIESTKDSRRGPVASVIVQNGTLSPRQDIVTEETDGRVKQLISDKGVQLLSATPGTPVEIIGFKDVPAVGSIIHDLAATYDEVEAVEAAVADIGAQPDNDFADLFNEKPKLPLIIKADVQGTLEAITMTIDEESVELVTAGVGPVIEQDIELALATGAAIISFHTKVPNSIKELAKRNGVKIKTYDVIYQLIEDLQKQMLKLLEPTIDEVVTGEAEIMQMFTMKGEKIAGSKVKSGEIKRNDKLHLKRGDEIIANPVIKFMMHGKEEIQSVKAKNEFGVTFKNRKLDFQPGDILIAYKQEDEV